MKRVSFVLSFLMVLSLLLTACVGVAPSAPAASSGDEAPAADSSAGGSQEGITLTYMASQGWIKDAELELAKKFEAETGIHVDYQIIPADQYFNVLKTKLNSGEATDIFGGQSGKTDLKVQYDVEKNAVDLTGEEWTTAHGPALPRPGQPRTARSTAPKSGTRSPPTTSSSTTTRRSLKSRASAYPRPMPSSRPLCDKLKAAGINPIYEPISDGWHHVLWFPMVGPRYEEAQSRPGRQAECQRDHLCRKATRCSKAMTQLQELYKPGLLWRQRPLRHLCRHQQETGQRQVCHGADHPDRARQRSRRIIPT